MIAGSCFYVKYLKYQALLFVPYNTRQRYQPQVHVYQYNILIRAVERFSESQLIEFQAY